MLNTFNDFINESAYTDFGNMKFIIKPSFSGKLTGIEFIPDWETLEDFSKREMVKEIQKTLKKSKSLLSDLLMYVPISTSDSLLFEIDMYSLADALIKELR